MRGDLQRNTGGRSRRAQPPFSPQPAAAHPHSRGPALGAAGLATEEKVRRPRAPGDRVSLSCSEAAAMLKDGEPERTSAVGAGRGRKCVTWERKRTGQRVCRVVAQVDWCGMRGTLTLTQKCHSLRLLFWVCFCLFVCCKSFFRLSLLFMYFTYIVFSCISQTHHVPALPTAASRGHEVRKVVNFLVGALWVLETEPGSLGRVVPA